jgi:hypothetical protein
MTAKGKTGHASIMFEDTAAEKIHKIINKLLGLREQEKARLKANPQFFLGDVTSINMTMLSVGPYTLSIYIFTKFLLQISGWTSTKCCATRVVSRHRHENYTTLEIS